MRARADGPAAHPALDKFVPRANVHGSPAADHFRMTRPQTASKVLLVADRRPVPASRRDTPIRRYRLARLRLDSRAAGDSRYEYLKRTYD
jgi:hypothetical protein